MALMGNAGKQVLEYSYDVNIDGGTAATYVLSNNVGYSNVPVGCIVTSVTGFVKTAFASAGSATLEWGTNTDPNGWSGATIAVASLTIGSVWNGWDNGGALIFDDTNDHPIFHAIGTAANGQVESVVATATMTDGHLILLVEVLMPAAHNRILS